MADGYCNISAAVIAVACIAGVGAGVGCTAITCICGIGRFIGTSRTSFSASVLACGRCYIRSTVIAISRIAAVSAVAAGCTGACIICICGFVGTSRAVFSASPVARGYGYIRTSVKAVSRIARIRARVGCAAVACICGIGRFIGTSRAVFARSILTDGYCNIRGCIKAVPFIAAVFAGIAYAAIACIVSVGRFIAANSAIIAISVLTFGRSYAVAAVIAVTVVTFPSTSICGAAGACIRRIVCGFVCTIFAITACISPLSRYCIGTA